jgi:hypothetical protein
VADVVRAAIKTTPIAMSQIMCCGSQRVLALPRQQGLFKISRGIASRPEPGILMYTKIERTKMREWDKINIHTRDRRGELDCTCDKEPRLK